MRNDFSIIIPTHFRHNYLDRILDYYSKTDIPILVVDSTNEIYQNKTKYSNVEYLHYPNYKFADKMFDAVQKISTKYVTVCADDDFITPNGIVECVSFLETNPDYGSAQGSYLSFKRKGKKIDYKRYYQHSIGLDIDANSAIERITSNFSNYMHTSYCTFRKDLIIELYKNAINYKIYDYILIELLYTIVWLANGKHKILPVLYSARESCQSTYNNIPRFDELASNPKYSELYKSFLDCSANIIAQNDNCNESVARNKLEIALSVYIDKSCTLRMENKKRSSFIRFLMKIKLYSLFSYFYYIISVKIVQSIKTWRFVYADNQTRKDWKIIKSLIKKHNIID